VSANSETASRRYLAEQLLHALKARGAGAVFGIPGDYALPLFDVLVKGDILPLYTLSHEPGVAYAADASGRVTQGLGVAVATYGAGALNLVNGVAGAYAERSPLVVISAAPARAPGRRELLLHHQVAGLDCQLRVFREITCAQAVLDDPETAPGLIARTLDACVKQSLPVYIEIPRDMAQEPCDPVPPPRPEPSNPDTVAECAAEIATIVEGAERPVLMVGVEVRRYGIEAEVVELVRHLGIPVVTSFMGRGVAATHSLNSAGCYLGLAGDPEIAKLVEESDALILLGVIFCDGNLGLPASHLDLRRVVHAFAGAVRISHHEYRDVALKDLVNALRRKAEGRREVMPVPARRAGAMRAPLLADDGRIRPSDISGTVNGLFASHGVMPVICDVGDCLFVSLEIEHADLVAQAYYVSMGFAVPAAFAVQAAGKRPIVLVGDGAFQMTGWELGNCQRYGFDPIVLVLNNKSWDMLRAFSRQSRFNDLSDWHFAELAGPLGGDGARVTTRRELVEALEKAWATRGRFQLIDIALERGVVSDTLDRFVGAFARAKAQSPKG